MEIIEITNELKSKNILHIRKGHLSLNPMYKYILDGSSESIIDSWMSGFRSEREGWWCLLHNVKCDERPRCPICGEVAKFNERGYNLTCGNCNYNDYGPKKEKIRQSTTEESKKQRKINYEKTCLERYGKKNANQFITPEKKELYIEKCKSKFGTSNAGQSKEAKEKRKNTLIERYGVTHNFKLIDTPEHAKEVWDKNHDSILEKTKMTQLEKYGAEFYSQTNEWKTRNRLSKSRNTILFETENNCILQSKLIRMYGQGWLSLIKDGEIKIIKDPTRFGNYISNDDVPKIIDYVSSQHDCFASNEEIELRTYIENLIGKENVKSNDRTVISTKDNRYELDIYVPDSNLAIEYNGVYWHSIENVDKKYHLTKSKLCENKGIRLIHIFENEWKSDKEKCKSLISSALNVFERRIYARECNFKQLSIEEYRSFCNENHLQGSVNSKYKFALEHNGEIVEVIGIGKSRFNKNELELHRLCTKKFTNVIGGFQKLLKHALEAIDTSDYDYLISYVDLAKYTGVGYEKCGFEYMTTTPPSYFYIDKHLHKHNRIEFQKHKLCKILEKYDDNLTEQENVIRNKYFCIYDCGTKKYKYNIKNEQKCKIHIC